MPVYVIVSNGKEKGGYGTLKKADSFAKKSAIRTGKGYEVLKSLYTFEGESGKKMKSV